MEWSNQDPRELVSKRANIVVWASQGEVFRAEVETHQSWDRFKKWVRSSIGRAAVSKTAGSGFKSQRYPPKGWEGCI